MSLVFQNALRVFIISVFLTPFAPAFAETLRIVDTGTARELNVPMNRAIVIESARSFAELSIANPEIADISSLSSRTIYVLGKTPGLTTLTLFDATGRLITNVNVRVSADISEFKERLRQILPGEKIEVRTANDGIVLSGTVSSNVRMQRALSLAARYAPDRISNLMTVGGVQQVMLKVRFAEVTRNVSKTLRASLGARGLLLGGEVGGQIEGGTLINGADDYIDPGSGSNGTLPPVASDTEGIAVFGFNTGVGQVVVLLEALENKGVVRTLAEPNLVALSGQSANFHAGGEVPIPAPGNDGNISIDYRPFGVELDFVPVVLDDELINLQLNASVSALDQANAITTQSIAVPALTKRQTSTTIELRDGQSFAIAGLLQDDFQDLSAQVPWLGDLPVLGALFRSASFERGQSELIVIITAHLVTPTRSQALISPTDLIQPPTESDLFLLGRTARTIEANGNGLADEVARQDFSGSYGYVLD